MQKEKQRQAKQDKMDSLVAVANNKQLSVSVRRTAAWEALDLDPSVFDPDTFASFMTHLKILEDDSVRDAQAMAMIEQDRAQFRMIQSFETKRDSCLKIGQKKNASLMQSRIDSLWHRIFSQ